MDSRSTKLPELPLRRRRRNWGRSVARVLCAVFALIGVLPLGLVTLLRSDHARAWAMRETSTLLTAKGVHASYTVEVSLWPLAVSLAAVRVEASDGGSPLLTADRVSVRPKLFGLLSGKFAIDQIEVDAPHVRAVVRKGKLVNLGIDLPESKPSDGPMRAPFGVVAVTDAWVDLDIDGTRVRAQQVDADVTVADDVRGSSFEIGLSVAQASISRRRPVLDTVVPGKMANDDDVLCKIDARVRVDPRAITVRRLSARGAADLDAEDGTTPPCDLPDNDARKVELSLAHARVELPEKGQDLPRRALGHVALRAPLAVAARFVNLPNAGGWVKLDLELRYAEDTQIPDVSGHIAVRDVQIAQFRFAKAIDTDVLVRNNVITSPKTVVKIAEGTATLTDTVVEPLAKGVPLKTSLLAEELDFAALMRDLGVSDHAHVQWDLHEVKAANLSGTITPLKLDGDLSIVSSNFAVYDKATDDPTHARIISFKEGRVQSRVAVRAGALEFKNIRAQLPRSTIDGGFCSIGFDNELVVDVPKARFDITDIAPIGDIVMTGVIEELAVHVKGKFNDLHLEGDVKMSSYTLGETPFGDVTAAHVKYSGTTVDLSGVAVKKGKSTYEVPTARLEFGGKARVQVDAVATSSKLDLRDLLAIFHMEEDPRFAELGAEIATRTHLHVALGGPEDLCGDGFFDVRSTAHLKAVDLFGERFDDGDVSMIYRWIDREAGIQGADLELKSVVLHKALAAGGTRAVGSVIGSATVARGGHITGGVVIESVPLGRIQALGGLASEIDGAVSGFAQVSGSVDAFRVDAELDGTPVRIRNVPFGASHAHATMTQHATGGPPIGQTRCGGQRYAAFDKEAYRRDTASAGEFVVDGDLLGKQVLLEGVTMTRQKSPHIAGIARFRRLDLGAVVRAFTPATRGTAEGDGAAPRAPLEGELSGDLDIRELSTNDLPHAYVRFVPQGLTLTREGQVLTLRPGHAVVKYARDVLDLPAMVFDVRAANGFAAAVSTSGLVYKASQGARLNLDVVLSPVDLSNLVGIVPRLETSAGRLEGALHIGGRAGDPEIDGQVRLRGGDFAIRGSPSALSEVDLDIAATSSDIRVTRGTAKFAGGTVEVRRGSVPLRELSLGNAEAEVVLRDMHVSTMEGVSGTIDAVLLGWNPQATGSRQLPRVSGDVTVTSFEYTRPVNLVSDLTAFGARSLGVKSQRTVVESYDPSLDVLAFDVRVRSRVPLRIRNNLVDVALRIDSSALTVTGTNQRFGLRGDLRTVAGGLFHFRNSDFEIRQGAIRFDDPTRILPHVDVIAVTEYRRYQEAGAGGQGAPGAGAGVTSRTAGFWRITLHAFGDAENLKLDMTSEPSLSREDIVLLLTIGMTRAEVDQVQAGSLGAGLALEALATASGADRAVKEAVPLIDDFRFGERLFSRAGRTVPQISVGKRVSEDVRAQVTTGLAAESRELRSNIEWRLGRRSSVLGSYDNINTVSGSPVGNVGVDFRWRLEFE